jgi:hypothetical protein
MIGITFPWVFPETEVSNLAPSALRSGSPSFATEWSPSINAHLKVKGAAGNRGTAALDPTCCRLLPSSWMALGWSE